jgi:hypothetical protein
LTEYNVQNEDSLPSELGRKNWKSFIQSAVIFFLFLHCRLVQTKTSCWELTWQKWFSITYKSNMKTTRQGFQMIAHCLFTSIDSNEKSQEIRMQVKISECGRSDTPARERTGNGEISGISSFVWECPAQNGRVGRYALYSHRK